MTMSDIPCQDGTMASQNLPRIEAQQAAAWWADHLSPGSHDVGGRDEAERESSAFATMAARLRNRTFTDEQRAAFRDHAAQLIEAHLQHWESGINESAWRPDNPQWGSALRTIKVDYHPDPVLREAAERAGFRIGSLDLPMKTVMWINPGEVKVAEGYGGPITMVWQQGEEMAP